jgi:hypothetical protein
LALWWVNLNFRFLNTDGYILPALIERKYLLLLLQNGTSGKTALYYAALGKREDIVKLLLERRPEVAAPGIAFWFAVLYPTYNWKFESMAFSQKCKK